ncbi:MAG: hypothetical protein LBO80_11555 [Treponema sp.]|jgi:hypothetical protein|nr:hypothetical protein [Treponema sp.]
MSEPLILRRLCIIPTIKCTLCCKLCSNYIPIFGNVEHVSIEELINDIDQIFDLVDYTEWLQFVGGEIFMRKDLWQIYEYCLTYRKKFEKLILITNATLLPCNKDVDIIKRYGNGVQVQISDYGKYSYKTKEMTDLFMKNDIPYVVKKYYGEMQHYGGWVDNTHFEDRGKSEAAIFEQHKNCGQVVMQNFHLYRGKFQGCARSLLASVLGKIIPAERDFVDLYDNIKSKEEKREIIRHFNDSPRVSCRSCVSFSENVERFPAAEQL